MEKKRNDEAWHRLKRCRDNAFTLPSKKELTATSVGDLVKRGASHRSFRYAAALATIMLPAEDETMWEEMAAVAELLGRWCSEDGVTSDELGRLRETHGLPL